MNNQFDSLRTLLQNSNISTKKDKYSVLKNSYDFILKLRHLYHLTEIEISRFCHSNNFASKSNCSSTHTSSLSSNQYKDIFMNSSVAMVVTELDGRFFLCNDNFTRLTGYSGQNINSKTIYDCLVPEEVPHLFTTFHQLSSSLSQLDEPYQTLATFQFSKSSIPIQCSVTVWMFEHLSNPQSLYFQLIILPLSEEIGSGQSVAPSSATSSTSTSVGTNPQLAAHFPSPSSTGTTFVASHLHPLPLLPSTPVLVPEESESSSKQCQSPINIFEGEDVKSPDESFRSSYTEASSFFIPSYQFYRSIPNPYPHSQNPTYGFPYSSSDYLASASYQPSPSPHHAAGGMAQYDQDESDDTFENMPENWFEQDGEEDPEDDS